MSCCPYQGHDLLALAWQGPTKASHLPLPIWTATLTWRSLIFRLVTPILGGKLWREISYEGQWVWRWFQCVHIEYLDVYPIWTGISTKDVPGERTADAKVPPFHHAGKITGKLRAKLTNAPAAVSRQPRRVLIRQKSLISEVACADLDSRL